MFLSGGRLSRTRVFNRIGYYGLLTVLGLALFPTSDGGAQEATSPPAYAATSSARGVLVRIEIPGFPATRVPVDSGGPTAQVGADSLGTSTAYAAFPDPGDLVITGPGLVAGLLAGGAFGLPPIDLPEVPPYPLAVSSDTYITPSASMGSGPYELKAESEPNRSEASATAGFRADAAGRASLVTSTASVVGSADEVVVRARSDIEGLTIGPLTIGQITSTATQTLTSDGTVQQSTDLEISAIKIAGIAVSLGPDGIGIANQTVPIPVDSSLTNLLSAAGISVKFIEPQEFDNTVVAPTIEITMPFEVPEIGPGTMTVVFGYTSATMSGGSLTEPPASLPEPTSSEHADQSGTGGPVGPPTMDLGGSSPQPTSPADELAGSTRTSSFDPADAPLLDLFDIRSAYLVLVGSSLVMSLVGLVIRTLGVRSPWKFTAG